MTNQAVDSEILAEDRPVIRRIGVQDLPQVLRRGWEDFQEKPSHLIFLYVIYPVVALILSRLVFGYNLIQILFPLAAGFALIGPFAAIGLYELSRRREQGQPMRWQDAFEPIRSQSLGRLLALGGILAIIFLCWLGAALLIYNGTIGDMALGSIGAFLGAVFGTSAGWTMILIGNFVGFLFAAVAFIISVVSFPLILDRPVGVGTAIGTSIRAVTANPAPMTCWGLIVAVSLLLGSLPAFIGLAVVLPVLGHATWHLYRAVVE